MPSVSECGSSPPSTSSFVLWTLNPSTWSAAQAMLEWAKHDHQGVPVLPDALCLQEHRLKGSFRHQSAVKWAQQRGLQASMPKAESTGPGPSESSAGRAVFSQLPSDKLDLSCGKELPSSRIAASMINV
eukprot:2726102-Pyramimonas_sp.AAC.1